MVNKSFFGLVLEQKYRAQPVLKADLSGKTVIVVGANTGIGYQATKHFATMKPARLILACRSKAKGEAAVAQIVNETGYKKAELWLLDLSKFSSVVEFADKFEKDGGRLDYLVANAGIAVSNYEATPDGWESTIQVNDLSTSLLSILLLPRLVDTARRFHTTPRLVVVASDTHYLAVIPKAAIDSPKMLKTLGDAEFCTPSIMKGRYFLSKLLNVLFVRAFNDHLSESTPVIIDSVNPGLCSSELGQARDKSQSLLTYAANSLKDNLLAHTAEEGSRQLIWAALANQGEDDKMRGVYVSRYAVEEGSDLVVHDLAIRERVWTETLEILETVTPKVRTIVDEYLTNIPSA